MNKEEIAINRLIKTALQLWKEDVHNFSTRQCSTCKAISTILSEPWGCVKMAKDLK